MQSETIKKLIEHVTNEVNPMDRERVFDDMLDECYSFDKVGGPFEHMSPSRVLKEVDPVAYRCGVNDYFGTDDNYYEIDGDYYPIREVDNAKDEFLDELTTKESELEEEIEELDEDDDGSLVELRQKTSELADVRAKIEEVRKYVF